MIIYISILRGINVSGQKMIKMDALKQLYVEIGLKNVTTYIQSGNIVFQCEKKSSQDLEQKIHKKILEQFGFEVPVQVIELASLQKIIKANPFQKDKLKDAAFFHITFLSGTPKKTTMEKIIPETYSPDEFKLMGQTIYLYCPNGYGTTKLTNTFFENKLKLSATTRNWKTTNELVKIAEQLL
jgi:uncharacterized protein (DUF1697 family)